MNNTHSVRAELSLIFVFIGIIWLVFILDRFLPLELLGLVPRTFSGLMGIVTMPFLHQDLKHIISNTPPLILLLTLLAGSRGNSKVIVGSLIVVGGVLLWLLGRGNSLHIGASGLVFGLITFLIASGFFEKRMKTMLISGLVGFFYGATLLMGVLPGQTGVSWDGHLFGGVAGVLVAWLLLKK